MSWFDFLVWYFVDFNLNAAVRAVDLADLSQNTVEPHPAHSLDLIDVNIVDWLLPMQT